MRWFWIMVGVLLALGAGYIFLRNYIKVKYGPQALSVKEYRCVPEGPVRSGEELLFTAFVFGLPPAETVEVRIGDERAPVTLRDDGIAPDSSAGDWRWTGTGTIHWSGNYAKSVCLVARQGQQELIWLAPPLTALPFELPTAPPASAEPKP